MRYFSPYAAHASFAFKMTNLTEYVDLFSWEIGVFIIWFIQDLPYPGICDIKLFKKKLNPKICFYFNAKKCRLLLAKCLLIDGLAATSVNTCLFWYSVIYMLNLPLSLLFFLLSMPCIGKLKEPMLSCYIQCLLKQNFNKACSEDEAMPLVCWFPPNCADHAAVVSVVSVLVWTHNCQCTQPVPHLNVLFTWWWRNRYLGRIFGQHH